jgi:L-ascorbate metabolism protein UlaG (beta-lactamase superfamily)
MASCVLEYFGHCAFRWITGDGVRIVIDPFDNDESRPWLRWFRQPMPEVDADVALVTHDHFDHRAIHRVRADTVIRDGGELTNSPDVKVVGVSDEHVPGHGPVGMPNVIYLVEVGGVRCCHWGDNRADPPESVIERLQPVDILMLPIDDSCHLLQFSDVDAVVAAIQPRVVIPTHYLCPRVSDERSPLRGVGAWQRSQPLPTVNLAGRIGLAPRLFPDEQQIWLMDPLVTLPS